MSDGALAQLLQFAGQFAVPTMAVLDENAAPLPPNPYLEVLALGNRSDICNSARLQGWPCSFSDFEFDAVQLAGRQQAVYRISKEKRVVEHVLQALWQLLPVGGVLCIAGYKQEGVKTFAARAQQTWLCETTLARGRQQLHLYRFVKTGSAATPLNADDYHALRPIGNWQHRTVYSKPGIFAWNRFDAGSLFLLEQLPQYLPGLLQTSSHDRVALDLGCGYGLLGLALLEAGCSRVVATDNNAAALLACARNLEQHAAAQTVSVVAGDCGDTMSERFDVVLCNPPFHQGFGVEQDLTDRFLQGTRRLLKPGGRALFVVNAFIPLERKAAPLFAEVQTMADNRRYRVVLLGG
jgi:16S rRNA (guanine1207-N2)-methyltransferase